MGETSIRQQLDLDKEATDIIYNFFKFKDSAKSGFANDLKINYLYKYIYKFIYKINEFGPYRGPRRQGRQTSRIRHEHHGAGVPWNSHGSRQGDPRRVGGTTAGRGMCHPQTASGARDKHRSSRRRLENRYE